MIQFFGNEVPVTLPDESDKTARLNVAFQVSDARAKELAERVADAVVTASNEKIPDMPFAKGFSLGRMLEVVNVDCESPGELVLVGMMLGRSYAEQEKRSEKSMRRITKMMHLMASDPEKAQKKMFKDLHKHFKKDKGK